MVLDAAKRSMTQKPDQTRTVAQSSSAQMETLTVYLGNRFRCLKENNLERPSSSASLARPYTVWIRPSVEEGAFLVARTEQKVDA